MVDCLRTNFFNSSEAVVSAWVLRQKLCNSIYSIAFVSLGCMVAHGLFHLLV